MSAKLANTVEGIVAGLARLRPGAAMNVSKINTVANVARNSAKVEYLRIAAADSICGSGRNPQAAIDG